MIGYFISKPEIRKRTFEKGKTQGWNEHLQDWGNLNDCTIYPTHFYAEDAKGNLPESEQFLTTIGRVVLREVKKVTKGNKKK